MQIQMIGHASIFVSTENLNILMDPILWDPHQEDLFDIHPKREVIHEKLPDIDLIVLSHRHLDHFDIRSLAYLAKDVPVLFPKDPLLENYLKKLGYTKLKQLKDFTEVKIGATTLFTTRSENPVPEYGLVFADSSGVFWNQVDSVVWPATVRTVSERFPKIDLLLAAWQPMLELNYQTNGNLGFPYDRYSEVLYNIGLARPKALAPGANGFCYTGACTWMNQVVFPVSRERFLHDVQLAAPSVAGKVMTFDPGDKITIEQGECHHAARACEFVRRLDSCQADLKFSPVIIEGNLIDPNPDAIPEAVMMTAVEKAIEKELQSFVSANAALFELHRKWPVIYQLNVVFPGHTRSWIIDFSRQSLQVQAGESALANMTTYITGSSLYGIITGTRGWDYAMLGSFCRRFQRLYTVTSSGVLRGGVGSQVSDPLELLYPYQQVLEKVLDRQVNAWLPASGKLQAVAS